MVICKFITLILLISASVEYVRAARAGDEMDRGYVITEENYIWGHYYTPTLSEDDDGRDPDVGVYEGRSGGDGETTERGEAVSESDVKSWGCFEYWSKNHLKSDTCKNKFKYYHRSNGYTPKDCLKICLEDHSIDGPFDIAYLKGVQCLCSKWAEFDKIRVNDIYCNIPCQADPTKQCGGNLALNMYCNGASDALCKAHDTNPPQDIPNYDLDVVQQYENQEITPFSGNIIESHQCVECIGRPDGIGKDCLGTIGFRPRSDYFPSNNPFACALNCRRKMDVLEEAAETVQVVSYLTYQVVENAMPDIDFLFLPQCVCRPHYALDLYFQAAESSQCTTECNLGENIFCGNKPNPDFVSAYCIWGQKDCSPIRGPPDPDPGDPTEGKTSESSSTTESYASSSTTVTTTTMKSTSTTTKSTSSSPTISSSFAPTTMETSGSSTAGTSTDLTTTDSSPRTTTSTESSTRTTTTLATPGPCDKQCKGRFEGELWRGCPGETVRKKCKEGATGKVTWYCQANATFQGSRPSTGECQSKWFDDVREEFDEFIKHNNTLPKEVATKLLDSLEENVKTPEEPDKKPYYGHEIKGIASLMHQIVNATNVTTDDELLIILNKTVTLSGSILANTEPWKDFEESSERAEAGQELFASMEESMLSLSKVVHTEKYNKTFQSPTLGENFLIGYGLGRKGSGKPLIFPHDGTNPCIQSLTDSCLILDGTWEELVEKPDYVAYSVKSELYKDIFSADLNQFDLRESQAVTQKIPNSNLLSLTLNGLRKGNLKGRKIRILFKHDYIGWGKQAQTFYRKLHPHEEPKVALDSVECVYWSTDKKIWTSDGCRMNATSADYTVCECDHLTSFAVLMDRHKYVGKDFALEILTYVLCSASVLCLLTSVFILSSVRSIQNQRTTITKHLCFSLMLGMVLILLVVDRNYFYLSMEVCTGVGIVTHYVFMVAFVWMAIEGVHLYKMVVHVFDSGRSRTTMYRTTAYGIPVLIVGVTCVVGFLLGDHPYGGEMYCWLEGPYIWGFVVPVIVIVTGNLTILFVALKTAYQMRATTATLQVRQRDYRTWIRGSFSVTVLLGVTWIPGFALLTNSLILVKVAAYIFVILNASQGIFLFVFHCLMNEKVRLVAGRKIPLLSWLSVSSRTNSKEPTRTGGRRSENCKVYVSEASKSVKQDPEIWLRGSTSRSKGRNGRSGSKASIPWTVQSALENLEGAVQNDNGHAPPTRCDSGLSTSSQVAFVARMK